MGDNVSRSAGSIDDNSYAASGRSVSTRIELSPLSVDEAPTRIELIRDVAVFQVKLAADGVRDLVLSPVSIVAGVLGILFGGRHARAPYEQVLKFGRRTDRWIDLFETHRTEGTTQKNEPSLDNIADSIEDIIRKDYANGGVSAATRTHIDEILKGFSRQHQAYKDPTSHRQKSGEK